MNAARRRGIIIFSILCTVLLVSFRLFVANKNGVMPNSANENLLGISKLISSQNNLKQDELLNKMTKLNKQFLVKQEARLSNLEEQNQLILEKLSQLNQKQLYNSGAPIRDKLINLVPYDSSVRFPAYIWQTWKHGLNDERFKQLYCQGETQWAVKNPGFVHELFNDDTTYSVVKHLYGSVPEVVRAYELLPEVILRMDFFRYLILFAKGGIYADIDTYPLQPIPNWIPENVSPDELGMIVSVEIDSKNKNWAKNYHRRLQFGQFVIQSKPGHPILREIISVIVDETLHKERSESLFLVGNSNEKQLDILKWTGSGVWTDVIMTYFNDYIKSSIYNRITWKDFTDLEIPKLVSDVLVLPKKSFASEIEIPQDGKIDDPLAFVKHYASKIWKTT
ncbi:alpha-1,6-mannosyltransferase Och1 [Yamadazyma tenuis]|uniref:alpha-1,6-mannosyltransferase Och1 n=1 Tax=Candida tenuis TaxID=2315449 RepID=UPI0027A67576|nr:alpha-1,6-mannosyltransferase Och1 [Yamadazyma tenuis]